MEKLALEQMHVWWLGEGSVTALIQRRLPIIPVLILPRDSG